MSNHQFSDKILVSDLAKVMYENPNVNVIQRRYFSNSEQQIPPVNFDELSALEKENVRSIVSHVLYAIENLGMKVVNK